jgi:hypothetical protein
LGCSQMPGQSVKRFSLGFCSRSTMGELK